MLSRALGLAEEPGLVPASVAGGIVRTWAGKYKALVKGPEIARVDGWACRVETEECEDALRFYETERCEVVRCGVEMGGEQVRGCMFRFVDDSPLA